MGTTKIVAVIPEQVYRYIVARADFMRSTDVKNVQVNIVFMTYRLEDDPARPDEGRLHNPDQALAGPRGKPCRSDKFLNSQ